MVPGGDKPNLFKEPQRKMDVLIIRLLMLAVVFLISAIVWFYKHQGISYGDPISFGTVCLFFILYLLWRWKNKIELIKQCILAAPFAILLTIVFKIIGFKTIISLYSGIALFLFLLVKAENRKQHFILTLTVASVLVGLITALKLLGWNLYNISIYKIYIALGCTLPLLSFYTAYLAAVNVRKNIEIRPLLSKSIVFAGVAFLLFVLFTISHMLCRQYHLGLVIPFIISVLLSLGFLWVCYRFKLSLSDSSVSNKTNEITNKKFIDKQKKFYAFIGKGEKTDKAGKCEFCGRSICSSEVSHAIKDHTVCEQCYKKIEDEKGRIT